MNVFQSCNDSSDITPLSASHGLYLKPVARLNISIQLPSLKTPGKSISNSEMMEKLRHYAAPEEFMSIKVSKSTLEVVRFEGEIQSRSKLPAVLARLDGRSIKLTGFHESLKVRAAEAKPDFPSRHSWDSYFRDAKNMNEMKPGERPDTIHITNLPCKWFATKSDTSKPSEYILRKVFEVFGEIRCVDIPMIDPFRSQMKSHISGVKMFSTNHNMIFEAYIQFKEYFCFVKTMDALRGMKLVHKEVDGKAFSASIKVDFDKSKHLSDSSIRRRRVERERLMAKEREREDKERQTREEEEKRIAAERKRLEEEKAAKLERQRQREERRKAKQLERLNQREAEEMNSKIVSNERLLLIAERRVESYRLLKELFERLKNDKEKQGEKHRDENSRRKPRNHCKTSQDELPEHLKLKEKELREKLVKKFKHSEQNDQSEEKRTTTDRRCEDDVPNFDNRSSGDHHKDGNQGFQHRGMRGRGNWRGRWRGNMGFREGHMGFRGHPLPPMSFQNFPNRPHFFPRWPHFPPRGRGGGDSGFGPPSFADPYYLDSAMNDPYYKYFHKIAFGGKMSRSRSSSRSTRSSYSRSHSRSYSRSRSRSYTRSRSRSSSHSRHRSKHRSRSRSRRRRRTRSDSRSHRRSSSNKRKKSSIKSPLKIPNEEKNIEKKTAEENLTQETIEKIAEKCPSVHTWSRSPSKSRSLSWEERKDEHSSSTKPHHKSKKEKKKKVKKEKKKKKKKTKDTTM